MRRMTAMVAAMAAVLAGPAAAQEKVPSASAAWVAEPPAGANSTAAYAVIDNPTMYEVFVVSVTCDLAASAEVVQGVAESAKAIRELGVPAYGQIELAPGGVYIRLKDFKKPLQAGDSVALTMTMDSGATVKVVAEVKKP